MGRQVFTAGEILTAADMNDLSDQSVMVFDDATARTTAIPTPVEGMVTYLKDTDEVDKFDGSAFVPVGIAPAILQVVQTVKTDTFTINSNNFTDITGFSASITPSSTSNKILVMTTINGACLGTNASATVYTRLVRDSTNILLGDAASGTIQTTQASRAELGNTHFQGTNFLDSPNTTSSVTYKLTISRIGSAWTLNSSSPQFNTAGRGTSTFTLMEVAG